MEMRIKTVEPTLVADFASSLAGRQIINIGVGPEGDAWVLAAQPQWEAVPFARYVQPGWASFPRSKVQPYPANILKFGPSFTGEVSLADIEEAYPKIQPLPGDEILVVAARCNYRGGDPEKNAAVYGPDGQLRRRFVLGDGINDVQVALDGTVWVSYFDEGVFGNYGWHEPMGTSGLIQFNEQGEILWRFQPSEEWDYIADCYAMNVVADEVWICYYTDFPVVRIRDGKLKGWANDYGGAHAITTDGHRVLLFGGYKDQRNRCIVQDLGDKKMARAREVHLAIPDTQSTARLRPIGRGSILHLFIGTA